MRRVPHPQPTPFGPPAYGREKLRSASFNAEFRSVSLSSNDPNVKQTARECMLELLTNAGPEGMDIERLARKVSVSIFKKFGCKSFAENVFLDLVNKSPFRREGGHIFYAKKEEELTSVLPPVVPVSFATPIKMERMEKTMSPAISQEKLDKIIRSADQSFERQTSSPTSKIRQPLASADYMLNREEGETVTQSERKTNTEFSDNGLDLKKLEPLATEGKHNVRRLYENVERGDENYPGLFTISNSPDDSKATSSIQEITALRNLDSTRLNSLFDIIVEVITRVAGNPYPIGQLLTEVTKAGKFSTAEIVLAVGHGPFTISELAQVNYVPELDTSLTRQAQYQTLINIVQA